MAYQKIKNIVIQEFEQEEIIEKRLIAGSDGVVTEHEIVVQPYIHTWLEVNVYQDINVEKNLTDNFKGELILHATTGEKGEGCVLSYTSANYVYTSPVTSDTYRQSRTTTKELAPGESITEVLAWASANGGGYYYPFPHWVNGTLTGVVRTSNLSKFPEHLTPGNSEYKELGITGTYSYSVTCITEEEEKTHRFYNNSISLEQDKDFTLLSNNRSVIPTTAANFTDEENPSFAYNAVTGKSVHTFYYSYYETTYYGFNSDKIKSLQAAISFDGITPDIAYRDIPIDGTYYTFELTDEEREILRVKAQGSNVVPIYYLTKVVRYVESVWSAESQTYYDEAEFINATQRNLTIVGCMPTLNPTVKDIKEETLALTGSELYFVRYESMAEFSTGATASKHATIVSQSVQCGSKVVRDLYFGIIDDVETASFVFDAVDSRGLSADRVVIGATLIEYVKPTCTQTLEIAVEGETGAKVDLTIKGKYFNGSFGLVDNTLQLECRYTNDDGEMGDWFILSGTPTFQNGQYELKTSFTGFKYDVAYTFQCRATDKLNVVESSQYTIKFMPVFDWSEEDFNFNVPVNINADELSLHGHTVLRHSATTKNTVLSAEAGHIYIRPGGTSETTGETIIYPDGSIDFTSAANFNGGLKINGVEVNDYIIEQGEEPMGSNGTWRWAKWASGRAECHGCRNFGTMAVTTNWGGLFRSEFLEQELPEKLFARTPDSININIVHATNGGWICKHENTAPSAITTGTFIFVRPASATPTVTNIGFSVVGEWK